MKKNIKKLAVCTIFLSLLLSLSACSKELKQAEAKELSTEKIEEVSETISEEVSEETSEVVTEQTSETPTEQEVYPEIDYKSVKPYELGQIMIIMYHAIVENPPSVYQRSPEEFRKDLETLYERGYRLLPLKDLMANNVTTAAGYTPVVITFDDGDPESFSLISDNGTLKPTPNCGLDIMMKFAEEHPDFGMSATFYVNGDNNPLLGEGNVSFAESAKYLIDHGCDLGNHTNSHVNLSECDAATIQEQLGIVDKMIKDALPGYEPVGVSYPFGIRPVGDDLKALILKGSYNGSEYNYSFALREGQSGASSTPNRIGFDFLNIPRARGSETPDENTDLWGMLRQFEENPERRYISDGNPNTIAVPEEYASNLEESSLGNKELVTYKLGE